MIHSMALRPEKSQDRLGKLFRVFNQKQTHQIL
jgi:hypothetical protein